MGEFRPDTSGRLDRVLVASLSLASALVLGYYLYWLVIWAPDTPSFFAGSTVIVVGFYCALSLFAAASVLVFVWFRWANLVVIVATLLTLYCLFQTEPTLWVNSWIFFNIPDPRMYVTDREALLARLRIISVAWMTLMAVISVLRLAPPDWKWRSTPINRRIWPAWVISFSVVSFWFVHSTLPYRTPGIGHGYFPDLVILHIEKNGMQFHETRFVNNHRGEFYFVRNDRRLMQYRFVETSVRGVVTPELQSQIVALQNPEGLGKSETAGPETLRAWRAEGWYLYGDNGLWAYTTENGKMPPEKITRVFSVVQGLPVSSDSTWYVKDVCMGFCYDTIAALGIRSSKQRCHVDVDGIAKCR